MENKNCFQCKHSIKDKMSYGAVKGDSLPPFWNDLRDCAKGHFNEIKEDKRSREWRTKVSEIGKNCEDFER